MSEEQAPYGPKTVDLRVHGFPADVHHDLTMLAAERSTSLKAVLVEAAKAYIGKQTLPVRRFKRPK